MGFSLAEPTARAAALQGRRALQRPGQLRVCCCDFLLLLPFHRAQAALKEELWLLFPKRQGAGIAAHTGLRKGCLGGSLAELAGSKAGNGHPSSVLCSASALPRYKYYKRHKTEVTSPRGSYKDESTKHSFQEDCAKRY